jgi:hypothetical protein
LQDHVIHALDLPIRLQVRHGGPVHANVVVVTEVEEFLPREQGDVVGDDRVGYAEALDDVGEERYSFLRANVHYGPGFYPLRELIDRHEEMRESPGCLS